jgi:hypothetical protein
MSQPFIGPERGFGNAARTVEPTRDEKGRPLPEEMSERELLIETVTVLRAVGDALAPMLSPEVARLGPIGMMRALMGGGG